MTRTFAPLRVTYACPHNGEPTRCRFCHASFPHRMEVSQWARAPIPTCERHRIDLVPS